MLVGDGGRALATGVWGVVSREWAVSCEERLLMPSGSSRSHKCTFNVFPVLKV